MSHVRKMFYEVLVVSVLAVLVVGTTSCKKSGEGATGAPQTQVSPPESGSDDAISNNGDESGNDAIEATNKEPAESGPESNQDALTTSVETEANMIPLHIELPRPMFVGTPTDIRIDNLEKPLGKARPAIMVPEGTTNVALEKPVTSSDDMPIIGDLEQATDGDKEGTDGSWVELGPGVQWLQVDMGAEYKIYAVLIWHYHRQAQVYKDVVVQVADDADFITNVKTLFNNDIDNSAGLGIGKDKHYVETSEGKLIKGAGVKARYVRLYSNGNTSNDQNYYTEVEVYGKPAE